MTINNKSEFKSACINVSYEMPRIIEWIQKEMESNVYLLSTEEFENNKIESKALTKLVNVIKNNVVTGE